MSDTPVHGSNEQSMSSWLGLLTPKTCSRVQNMLFSSRFAYFSDGDVPNSKNYCCHLFLQEGSPSQTRKLFTSCVSDAEKKSLWSSNLIRDDSCMHRKIKTQILGQPNPETKGKKKYFYSTFWDLFATSFRRFLIILVSYRCQNDHQKAFPRFWVLVFLCGRSRPTGTATESGHSESESSSPSEWFLCHDKGIVH